MGHDKASPWHFAERAVAFAGLALTKRGDVKARPQTGKGRGIDLLVEVRKGGRSTLRLFGVQVVGHLDLPDDPTARPCGTANRLSEAPFPICVFVVGVRALEGLCRWAMEPVVESGLAVLRPAKGITWQPIDEASVARLIDQVSAWYDARNGGSPRLPGGRRAKTAG